ncbi:hypothetical protein R3P38DRAFT_2925733 [Favolaschia claudopus]|uniref:Saccharopine dehydrogenase [NAD(+), L-lysine-forming] n=1 Tax=Favolaschia claudopus TaxID=2862362 RepID=A0AAW0BZL6_9AGAR
MGKPIFWLRCETKELERRAALAPIAAKRLIEAGFTVFVERDEQRTFDDSEYEAAGCTLVDHNSWRTAPPSATIIGLKELQESTEPLAHKHIYFGHCYKKQAGWSSILSRFHRGGGTLYDIEFLTDTTGRRVAAFGFHAGFAGAAVGALAFAKQSEGEKLGRLNAFETEAAMVKTVEEALGKQNVKVLVIGALGRCGSGAVELFQRAGVPHDNIIKWDMAETAKGGPFNEILDVDIFVNCIYLSSQILPFITREQLIAAGPQRRLSIIVDVSCDTTNPFNPLPVYSINTTFIEPTVPVDVGASNPPISVVSIDHLPALVPREASEKFSQDLLPSLLDFANTQTSPVWSAAEKIFREKMQEAAVVEGLA